MVLWFIFNSSIYIISLNSTLLFNLFLIELIAVWHMLFGSLVVINGKNLPLDTNIMERVLFQANRVLEYKTNTSKDKESEGKEEGLVIWDKEEERKDEIFYVTSDKKHTVYHPEEHKGQKGWPRYSDTG